MKHRAARVLALQIVLHFKGKERIVREAHRQLRAVGVIRIGFGTGLKNIGETFAVFFSKAVRRTFGRRSFQVIHVTGFFLEFNHTGAHMIQKF